MVRYAVGVLLGLVVTFALFTLMRVLIHNDENPLNEAKNYRIADFLRVQEDEQVELKDRKPKPPPPPDEPPPDMIKPQFDSSDVSQGVDIGAVAVNVDLNVDAGGGFSSDGEYLPIVKVAPIYPRRAQTRGIEGYCIVEYTVTKNGSIRDPQAIDCQPAGIFERASLKASLKFKYKPRVVDGEAIEVAGVQNKFTYELEK